MKKLGVFLGAAAFVLAVACAFTTKANAALVPYIAYFAPIGGQVIPCTAVTCDTQGTIDCVNYVQFNTYDSRHDGECIILTLGLKRKP